MHRVLVFPVLAIALSACAVDADDPVSGRFELHAVSGGEDVSIGYYDADAAQLELSPALEDFALPETVAFGIQRGEELILVPRETELLAIEETLEPGGEYELMSLHEGSPSTQVGEVTVADEESLGTIQDQICSIRTWTHWISANCWHKHVERSCSYNSVYTYCAYWQ